MLYAWIGFLKPGADQIPPSLQDAATDFLRQPLISILAAGPLRDASGTRAGMMMIFEHDSRDAAEACRQQPVPARRTVRRSSPVRIRQ